MRLKVFSQLQYLSFFFCLLLFASCKLNSGNKQPFEGQWEFSIDFEEELISGIMAIEHRKNEYQVIFSSFDFEETELENIQLDGNSISGDIQLWEGEDFFELRGEFKGETFSGNLGVEEDKFYLTANRQSEDLVNIDRSGIAYMLAEADLPDTEKDIDHAGIIADLNGESLERGGRIYNSNCINCHGNQEVEGSIPLSLKFWEQPFKAGGDLFSMYQTVTRGFGSMPPQVTLTPQEKYDVVHYIQQSFVRQHNADAYISASPGYLKGVPTGSSRGPEAKPYHPWADMDYGNFFINTYELVDEETGPERFHSPGPVPFRDEDYSQSNFAYKGIAVRLDKGTGGVSKGKAWMVFDHDLMRVAGGWTGDGFIDWEGILLNDRHETYPRTIGKLHFETPVGPAWANPVNGSFDDPRWRARDGRAFGPLPKAWADYKGLYHYEDKVIISYSVGKSAILERLGAEEKEDHIVFTRTLNIAPSSSKLKMRIAPVGKQVGVKGDGASLITEDGYHVLKVSSSADVKIKIFIADDSMDDLDGFMASSDAPEILEAYTKGGKAHYPEILTSPITAGNNNNSFAVDQLQPPFDNPWQARMKLSGIDFLDDTDKAVLCTTDGDIWHISGLLANTGSLKWKRIGSGLFQPLGIKVLDEKIYVICRDQLVLLRDLNGDGETDFYESFNHDHQVTDHFHEFAMGLQADKKGNLYYAKSGRHAREALIPQHGTLIKVSADGSKSEIVATGFRAANGVCINPDGSFIVTDQQGFWNPMNRINWVEVGGKDKFYGNMWGYNPPNDTTRKAMEAPMVWVDMEFDRSPSELLWVDSEKWGPLNGSLLSFSYGYGKIQLVLHEKVKGQMQGGVIDLPGIKFMTGVMRGRFNPEDGHLYACGMSAWGTSQMMKGGGLYRVRYTGKALSVPVKMQASREGLELTFASPLDKAFALNKENYEIETWDLIRSSEYGSERYNRTELEIAECRLLKDGKSVRLYLEGIKPVDVMTISYTLKDAMGNPLSGKVQNTIHHLGQESTL
ncbi:MAG: DUF6797 domain-containing protein [Bacteroidota bacterium]